MAVEIGVVHNAEMEFTRSVVAQRVTGAPTVPRRRGALHPLQRLQMQAGNAAVARLIAQRQDGTGGQASPSETTPGQLRIDAHEVPTGAGGATPAPTTPAPTTPAPTPTTPTTATDTGSGGGSQPTQRQFQVQYQFQGQATQATGQPPGQANQTSGAHQLTAQLNVSHHDDDHPGTEQSYAVQGSVDANTGHFTGAVVQVQDALVTATRHHLQGQIFGNVSAGAATDVTGGFVPVVQAGVGVQGSVVINSTVTVFMQAQDQASLMFGSRGVTASNSEQVSAGIQITFP